MHKGKVYPYLREYWQCESLFWPGYVPRKVYVQSSGFNGDSWDLLAGGIVTDVGVPDSFLVGDPFWSYIDPLGTFQVELLLHKVSVAPKKYSLSVRMVVPPGIANVASTEIQSPQYAFGGWAMTQDSGAFLPQFNGNVPDLQIRPATWYEV